VTESRISTYSTCTDSVAKSPKWCGAPGMTAYLQENGCTWSKYNIRF